MRVCLPTRPKRPSGRTLLAPSGNSFRFLPSRHHKDCVFMTERRANTSLNNEGHTND